MPHIYLLYAFQFFCHADAFRFLPFSSNPIRVLPGEDPKSARKRHAKTSKRDEDESEKSEDEAEVRKPKIRIRLSAAKSGKERSTGSSEKKQGKKRKATTTPQKTENGNARKKSRRSTPGSSDGSDDEEDEMYDVETIQSEHDALAGTWEETRDFATKLGPWRLPAQIESKFKDVAKITLIAISK